MVFNEQTLVMSLANTAAAAAAPMLQQCGLSKAQQHNYPRLMMKVIQKQTI